MSAQTHTAASTDIEFRLEDIEALRGKLGVSQSSLCRRAGIAVSTYQRWLKYLRAEDGGVRPQLRTLRVVSEALSLELTNRQADRAKRLAS